MDKEKNTNNSNKVYKTLSIIFGIGLLTLGAFYVYKNFGSKKTITVTGTSKGQFSNQIATFNLTIETSNEEKSAAVDEVEARSDEIINSLKDFGIPDKDLKTQNLNVYQREEPVSQEGGITKFEPGDWYASYTVEIILRDLDRSRELTGLMSDFEDASLFGPNLSVDTTSVDDNEVLAAAVEDAREKAETLAENIGKRLGDVVSIQEGSSGGYVEPMFMRAEGLGGGAPIEPGSTEITKTVTVTFTLK